MNLNDENTDYKNKCLKIVQKYIEINQNDDGIITSFHEDEFLNDCFILTKAYFEDLTEERASLDFCGYVLCNNRLSETSRRHFKLQQKYHIKNNRVYEISRRKNFCSDLCFKKNEFLRDQISSEPLYIRKKDELSKKLKLYQSKTGQCGDEVHLLDKLTDEVKEQKQEKRIVHSGLNQSTKNFLKKHEQAIENKLSAPYLKVEEFNELKQKFKDFNIHEKFRYINDFNTTETSRLHDDVQINREENDFDFNKEQLLDEIDRFSISTTSSMTSLSTTSRRKLKKHKFFLDVVDKISEWITEDTMAFLGINTEGFYGQSRLSLSEDLISGEDKQRKLERYRWEYIRLCAKLNKEEIEDEKYDQMVLKEKENHKRKKVSRENKGKSIFKDISEPNFENELLQEKLSNFFNGILFPTVANENISENKKVRFSDQVEKDLNNHQTENIQEMEKENENSNISSKNNEVMQLFLPLNDNQHAHIKRKQLFLKEIQQFLQEIDQIEINDILGHIRSLVDTFNLNANNTILGRKRNYLVMIFLLRILLIFGIIEEHKYRTTFESNVFIKAILDKFHLTSESVDDVIQKMFILKNNPE